MSGAPSTPDRPPADEETTRRLDRTAPAPPGAAPRTPATGTPEPTVAAPSASTPPTAMSGPADLTRDLTGLLPDPSAPASAAAADRTPDAEPTSPVAEAVPDVADVAEADTREKPATVDAEALADTQTLADSPAGNDARASAGARASLDARACVDAQEADAAAAEHPVLPGVGPAEPPLTRQLPVSQEACGSGPSTVGPADVDAPPATATGQPATMVAPAPEPTTSPESVTRPDSATPPESVSPHQSVTAPRRVAAGQTIGQTHPKGETPTEDVPAPAAEFLVDPDPTAELTSKAQLFTPPPDDAALTVEPTSDTEPSGLTVVRSDTQPSAVTLPAADSPHIPPTASLTPAAEVDADAVVEPEAGPEAHPPAEGEGAGDGEAQGEADGVAGSVPGHAPSTDTAPAATIDFRCGDDEESTKDPSLASVMAAEQPADELSSVATTAARADAATDEADAESTPGAAPNTDDASENEPEPPSSPEAQTVPGARSAPEEDADREAGSGRKTDTAPRSDSEAGSRPEAQPEPDTEIEHDARSEAQADTDHEQAPTGEAEGEAEAAATTQPAAEPNWFQPVTDPKATVPAYDGGAATTTAPQPSAAVPDAVSGGAGSDGAGSDGAGSDGAGSDGAGSDGAVAAEAGTETVLPAPETASGVATALKAPTMLTPVVTPAPTDPESSPDRGGAADPEQVLAAYPWRFHHETLRELVDDPDELREVRDGLTVKLQSADRDAVRARLLSLRAVVSRILGDLGAALADGREALEFAEATGELRRTAIVQARLAHVLQWRGDFAEADRLFAQANSVELPDRLRATMHEHAGRSCYDQGRYIEACNHFERALDLRKVEDPGLIARTEVALDAVLARVMANGWGPYPRSREDVLQLHRPPVPSFSDYDQRWGYADVYGVLTIPPRYADAQPFHEGAAWVRRPESRTWELIDETGGVLIDSSSAYLGAGSFSDGLAWVSRDGGGWFAINRRNTVVIPGGYDDVRPFRRGVAAVRRGGWGAIDSTGRVVVQLRYRAFATALTDGRYVDGFTDEGLAIVDAGDRKGVVDRAGRLIVAPVHAALVIHPVAFLIGDRNGRWGALDRRGDPLIDVVHASRSDVADEIDRLLADTRPVL